VPGRGVSPGLDPLSKSRPSETPTRINCIGPSRLLRKGAAMGGVDVGPTAPHVHWQTRCVFCLTFVLALTTRYLAGKSDTGKARLGGPRTTQTPTPGQGRRAQGGSNRGALRPPRQPIGAGVALAAQRGVRRGQQSRPPEHHFDGAFERNWLQVVARPAEFARVVRRIAFALVTLVLVGAADPVGVRAGELIRCRLPDGTVGFVDDASKVPPGAAIESSRPASAPTPSRPALEAPRRVQPPPPHRGYWSDGVEAARHLADRCRRYELPPTCSEDDVSSAGSWAARAEKLRSAVTQAEQNLEWYQRNYDECERSTGSVCSRRGVDRAKDELAARERAFAGLEEECQRQGCMPGWLREISKKGWE
jgi:hypothetical protein